MKAFDESHRDVTIASKTFYSNEYTKCINGLIMQCFEYFINFDYYNKSYFYLLLDAHWLHLFNKVFVKKLTSHKK